MRILLIDNHDSYTYNIYQLLTVRPEVRVDVLANDDPRWDDLDLSLYQAAVISPGPGDPTVSADFGHSASVLENDELPVLGICLGHQGMAAHCGAMVSGAPRPRHGHISAVEHTGHELFAGIPSPFEAVRYHSLHVQEPLPHSLEVLARSEDGLVMAIGHKHRPHWGLQFHPESISTGVGGVIIDNFLRLARHHHGRTPSRAGAALQAAVRSIPREVDTETIADYLDRLHREWIWLDSAQVITGTSRYSILAPAGTPSNPLSVHRIGEPAQEQGELAGSVFEFLQDSLEAVSVDPAVLPFPFKGGYIGFLGYEIKAECGLRSHHRSDTPDAVWVRCHRFIVVDHVTQHTYVTAVDPDIADADTIAWLDATESALLGLAQDRHTDVAEPPPVDDSVVQEYAQPRPVYVENVKAAQRELHRGNSYEVCLTNTLHLPAAAADPLQAYLQLRRTNPAPYAAFAKLADITVWCSSPERFLSVSATGIVESRPIKGTAPRSADPATDESNRAQLASSAKTLAENLMIVDLVRNDLGRVCRSGTVAVPSYMATEAYPTVHQLVSTIRGELASGLSAVDAIRASFPPGSMTGAPKLRTTDIIDQLETQARGIYSGALGYLSYDGAADLNVVIRTAVGYGNRISIGSGGAIVLDSDPDEEYEEMLLKARALVRIFNPETALTHV